MDLFEVFPQLAQAQTRALKGRTLRLIALSGIVYDDQAFYFELSDARFWGRLQQGRVAIGVGAAKIQPGGAFPPHHPLVRYLRRQWRCDVDFFPAGYTYVLSEEREVTVVEQVDVATPYFFVLTPPRLGGAEMPDALVQAVYLMPVRRWGGRSRQGLLRIHREALGSFLEPVDWDLGVLQAQTWAKFQHTPALPETARVRPILALRGLRDLLQTEGLLTHLYSSSVRGV